MIQITQGSDGWQVTGTPPPQIPPAGWDLLLRMIRAFLDMYRYAPPPQPPLAEASPAPTLTTIGAAMPPSPISPTALARSAGNPALAPLIELALTVVTTMLAGCRSDAQAEASAGAVTARRRSLIIAATKLAARRRKIKATDDEIARAVDAVLDAKVSQVTRSEFIRAARSGQ